MDRFVGRVAVVTGASGGIGLEISKLLVKHGLHVVGLARRLPKLEELGEILSSDPETYTGKFFPCKCDITNPSEIKEAFSWLTANVGDVTILINNAGVLVPTIMFEMDEEAYDTTFNTNVKGLLLCAKEAIESMSNNHIFGHIININSILGHQFINIEPNYHFLYTVSKHAVTAATEALRREVISKNATIKISSVSPGRVDTEFSPSATALPDDQILRPEDVADACIKVLDTPQNVLITELTIAGIYQQL